MNFSIILHDGEKLLHYKLLHHSELFNYLMALLHESGDRDNSPEWSKLDFNFVAFGFTYLNHTVKHGTLYE